MPRRVVTLRLWEILLAFAAITAAFVIGLYFVVHWNNQRIADIQSARLSSCERTYEGIREVFRPLFPAHPTPRQRTDLETFNTTIDRLRDGCAKQTRVKKGKA
jgi:hypothetical protein